MKLSVIAAALLAAATPVLSTVYITNPVASTTVHGGDRLRIRWQDSSASPKVSAWEGINIWLAAGSESSQYKLAQIASNVSTRRTSMSYNVPKNIGPQGKYYFIRMESTKTAPNGTAEAMSFSARFMLDQVTGTFNSSVLAAAQGKEGSAGGASSSSASSLNLVTSTSASVAAATTSASSSASSARSSSSSTSGAAGRFLAHKAVTAGVGMGVIAAGAVLLL
ncbi:unnamed protein product [Parajaminaea phylloscopi]